MTDIKSLAERVLSYGHHEEHGACILARAVLRLTAEAESYKVALATIKAWQAEGGLLDYCKLSEILDSALRGNQ